MRFFSTGTRVVGKTLTKVTFKPNVTRRRIFSVALGEKLRLRVTHAALRTIDKCGGLDNYLFRTKPEKLGMKGMQLRLQVQEALAKKGGVIPVAAAQAQSEKEGERFDKEGRLYTMLRRQEDTQQQRVRFFYSLPFFFLILRADDESCVCVCA
jgi:ribosomal protein L28